VRGASRNSEYGFSGGDDSVVTAPATDAARQWSGWGTALKPAHEPICMARKPLQGTVAANVLRHGTGAINVDGCRVGDEDTTRPNGPIGYHGGGTGGTGGSASGRWPANFLHDGSDEATAGLGEAARYFYTAKAGREDREEGCDDFPLAVARSNLNTKNGVGERLDGAPSPIRANIHPTVKPTDLMRYLVRMVTPLGGTVLDPFTGSGSTGRAAMLEGAQFIGCELSPEYAEIARARIRYTLGPLFAHEVE
jgi:site-specific DNA-methyltransferase (adenine-specific)